MRKLLASLTMFFALVGCKTTAGEEEGSSAVKFYGADSRRATLTFDTILYYNLPAEFSGDASTIYDSEMKEDIDFQIQQQLAHMFSSFVNHTKPFDFTGNPGIPRDRPEITVTSVEQVAGHRAAYVHYSYKDIAVFKKDLFHGSQQLTLPILLPKDPTTIYQKGLVDFAKAKQIFAGDPEVIEEIDVLQAIQGPDTPQNERGANLCTDLHYNSFGDYWYFWNPYAKGCPQATKDATIEVAANLKPLNSTTNTYPRYDTLYGDNGNGEDMRITFLVGIDENWKKADLGREGFEKDFRMLTEGKDLLGTDLLLEPEAKMIKANPDFRFQILKNDKKQKTLRFKQDGRNVLLNMYLVAPESEEFVALAKKGMKEADVFIYDGHSGLGGFLSVGRVFGERKEPLPKDKYQIFFFNGCSTFSYYNYDYFQLKATPSDPNGYANLDIVTSATPAAFSSGPGTDYWLIRALASGDRRNWQSIMNDVMKIAGDESALLHVNGDEGNPSTPHE